VERWPCPWREEENKLIPPDIVTENREPSPEPQPFNDPVAEQQQQQHEEGEDTDVLDLFGNEFPSDHVERRPRRKFSLTSALFAAKTRGEAVTREGKQEEKEDGAEKI
jgi:hypothetical protein